jgi:glycyl-tRNA synthetase
VTIDSNMVSFTKAKKKVAGKNLTPGVIEPSFGIGRILYSVLEHNYYVREGDEQRGVFSFPPSVAPVKVSIFPLLSNDQSLLAVVPKLSKKRGIGKCD